MSGTPEGDDRLACLDALLRSAVDVRHHVETVAHDLALTPPTARVLLLLEQPLTMGEIARRVGCEPSHVTGLASELEVAGLAEREVDPGDRRVRRLALTEAGQNKRASLVPTLLDGSPVLSELTDRQVRQLLGLLVTRPQGH